MIPQPWIAKRSQDHIGHHRHKKTVKRHIDQFSSAETKWCLHIRIVSNFYGLGPNQKSPLW
jgi:hypothetical protein